MSNHLHIGRLISDLSADGYSSVVIVEASANDETYIASLYDAADDLRQPTTMTDREGNKFLRAAGQTIGEALDGLDALCAVGEAS